MGNLFNGNKVLGELESCVHKIRPQQRVGTDNVSVCLFQGLQSKNMSTTIWTRRTTCIDEDLRFPWIDNTQDIRHAATIVAYRDTFNDTELECQNVKAVKQTVCYWSLRLPHYLKNK